MAYKVQRACILHLSDTTVIITYLENSTTVTVWQAHLVSIFNLFKLRCGSEKD